MTPFHHAFEGLRPHHYGVIYADPPWRHITWSARGRGRSPDRHYRTMTLEEICALPVGDLTAADCHLFLWAIGSHLPHALTVMAAWGFTYSSVAFTWVKQTKDGRPAVSMGLTTRKQTEMVLLGRRGKPRRRSAAVRELVFAPRGRHSEKPREVQAQIEKYALGPYAELFAREEWWGWDCWGEELLWKDRRI